MGRKMYFQRKITAIIATMVLFLLPSGLFAQEEVCESFSQDGAVEIVEAEGDDIFASEYLKPTFTWTPCSLAQNYAILLDNSQVDTVDANSTSWQPSTDLNFGAYQIVIVARVEDLGQLVDGPRTQPFVFRLGPDEPKPISPLFSQSSESDKLGGWDRKPDFVFMGGQRNNSYIVEITTPDGTFQVCEKFVDNGLEPVEPETYTCPYPDSIPPIEPGSEISWRVTAFLKTDTGELLSKIDSPRTSYRVRTLSPPTPMYPDDGENFSVRSLTDIPEIKGTHELVTVDDQNVIIELYIMKGESSDPKNDKTPTGQDPLVATIENAEIVWRNPRALGGIPTTSKTINWYLIARLGDQEVRSLEIYSFTLMPPIGLGIGLKGGANIMRFLSPVSRFGIHASGPILYIDQVVSPRWGGIFHIRILLDILFEIRATRFSTNDNPQFLVDNTTISQYVAGGMLGIKPVLNLIDPLNIYGIIGFQIDYAFMMFIENSEARRRLDPVAHFIDPLGIHLVFGGGATWDFPVPYILGRDLQFGLELRFVMGLIPTSRGNSNIVGEKSSRLTEFQLLLTHRLFDF